MKNYKFLLLLFIGLIFQSCNDDFLNPLPDSAIVVDAFFQSDDDVLSGIIGIYDAIQGVNENTETNTIVYSCSFFFIFSFSEA